MSAKLKNTTVIDQQKKTKTKTKKYIMNKAPCSIANSILATDISIAAKQHKLKELKIMETEKGFYIIVCLKWSKFPEWYLTTRRDRTQPKLFKDLDRLNKSLKTHYPNCNFKLFRNQELPPKNTK